MLDNYVEFHDFSVNPKFSLRPLIDYTMSDANIQHIARTYSNNTHVRVQEILTLESENAKYLLRITKKEILTIFGFLLVFSEYNYGVFVDLNKILMAGTFKGNPHRRFAFIVGMTGGGKSTFLRMVESFFNTANSTAKLSSLMISVPPKQDLDAASAPMSSCLIGVADEIKQLNGSRINFLCDEGKIGSRAIKQTESTQFRMTATLILASNRGFGVDDATSERMIPIIKHHILFNAKDEHICYLDEPFNDINATLQSIKNRFLNDKKSSDYASTASRLAGFHCLHACVPYVYEETLVGLYISIMYGRLFFLNSFLLPIDKTVTPPTLNTRAEYNRKYSPKIKFLYEFKIDPTSEDLTSKSDFDNTVHLWWTANKARVQMVDFDSNALLQLLEHNFAQYLTEDKENYRFKMTKRHEF